MIFVFFVMHLLKRVTIYFICVNIQKEFGEQFEEFWMSITKQNVCLSLKDITVCIIETNTSLLNYLTDSSWKLFYMELSKAKQFSHILFIHFAH